jgi:hypothetical protein
MQNLRLASTKSTLDTSNQEKYFSIATITDSQLPKSQRKREVLNRTNRKKYLFKEY